MFLLNCSHPINLVVESYGGYGYSSDFQGLAWLAILR